MGVQEQQHSLDQLAGERDACKSGAHEAADRSKVHTGSKCGSPDTSHPDFQTDSLSVTYKPADRSRGKTAPSFSSTSPPCSNLLLAV